MRWVNQVGQEGSRGSALITLMIIILLVSIAGASMVGFAKQQVYAVAKVRDYLKAQAYAEAGANEAYNTLKTNFALRSDPGNFPPRTFGDGNYAVSVQSVSSDLAAIVSTGMVGSVKSVVKMDVKNYVPATGGSSPPPRTNPWGHTILCNGYITHNGAGTCYGSVHANNYITCNGTIAWGSAGSNIYVSAHSSSKGFRANGSATIMGTVQAPVITVNGTKNITTEIVSDPGTVAFPTPDLTAYYNIAAANGQVFSSQSLNGSVNWGAIPGGVKWINGTFTQNGALTYSGCIIATGNITFNGSVNQTRVGDLPAIVSRDGTVKVNGSHTVKGLVFSKGDLTWNGSGTIDGAILVGGNMTFNGSYGLLAYTYSEPGDAGGGGGGGSGSDLVGVTAWQK